jgi:hypothetical protein
MSKPIVPVSTPSRKSDLVSTESYRSKPKHQTLQEWIEDTEYAIEALQTWLACLKQWQFQDTVSGQEFDQAYAVICDATLSEWAWVGLVELRIALTGEETVLC